MTKSRAKATNICQTMEESNSIENTVWVVSVNVKVFFVDFNQGLQLALIQFTKKLLGTFGWNRRAPVRRKDKVRIHKRKMTGEAPEVRSDKRKPG